MLKLDQMLMIGSAGTNVGKTELACAIIKKFGKNRPIIGIKVTTIKERDGRCPRGGQGCGVCSSLEGDFCITEEVNSKSEKDTARLLAAGANRVFWLRAMKTHLKEGLTALLDKIGQGAVSVCESNSLRQAVEPGLFLMVEGRGLKVWKSSAQDVRKYADRVVVADARGFDGSTSLRVDFDIDRIKLADGKWVMQEEATAIVMAGGDSSRMGTDKSTLLFNGKPLVEHVCEQLRGTFCQILISANEAEELTFLGLEIIPDRTPGQGPLMGIASALEASANELNFVVACDIPHIDIACVRRMLAEAARSGADIVIPSAGDGFYEPLFAIYRKSALKTINEVLCTGARKISDVFARCRVKHIETGTERLTNLNTRAEYEEFQKKYDD